MSEIAFAKYQASGNDFVVMEDPEDAGPLSADDVRALCDRWTGVGADGVIRLTRTAQGRFGFHLTNADGTPAAMSGNGMRCLGAYIHDRKLTEEAAFDVATTAGLRHVALAPADGPAREATVGMGTPGFTKAQIPMFGAAWETFLAQPFDIGNGLTVTASAVSMGNPHLVLFLDEDPESLPRGAHRARARASRVVPRAHQRGVRARAGRRDRRARVGARGGGDARLRDGRLRGGRHGTARRSGTGRGRRPLPRGSPLRVTRAPDGEVLLSGPVSHVFDGTVDPSSL